MNIDRILAAFNQHGVGYLLIGGVNFLLRHQPVLTYDVDLWVEDTADNLVRAEAALATLDAAWGSTEATWRPVRELPAGWLRRQGLYCLSSPHGAIDVFRTVRGLANWSVCRQRAVAGATGAGVAYWGLSDADILVCASSTRHCGNPVAESLKQREETKRERAWDPAQRWQLVQGTITWAESQPGVSRNHPASRWAEERRKLAALAKH